MVNKVHKCHHKYLAGRKGMDGLHDAQAGFARHKCVYCAYAAGYHDARIGRPDGENSETCDAGKTAPTALLDALPTSQAGIGRHKCAVCAYQLGVLAFREIQTVTDQEVSTYANDRDDSGSGVLDLTEIKRFAWHRRLERDPSINRKVKRHLGTACVCCGLAMGTLYGELGTDYIEAHHLAPLKDLKEGESRRVTAKDFAALCPNCHRMIHRLKDVSDLTTLRAIVRKHRAKKSGS